MRTWLGDPLMEIVLFIFLPFFFFLNGETEEIDTTLTNIKIVESTALNEDYVDLEDFYTTVPNEHMPVEVTEVSQQDSTYTYTFENVSEFSGMVSHTVSLDRKEDGEWAFVRNEQLMDRSLDDGSLAYETLQPNEITEFEFTLTHSNGTPQSTDYRIRHHLIMDNGEEYVVFYQFTVEQ